MTQEQVTKIKEMMYSEDPEIRKLGVGICFTRVPYEYLPMLLITLDKLNPGLEYMLTMPPTRIKEIYIQRNLAVLYTGNTYVFSNPDKLKKMVPLAKLIYL